MKKVYTAPKILIVKMLPASTNMLATSFLLEYREPMKQDFCPETLCPFNKCWCVDKQVRFNEWRDVIKSFADITNRPLYTSADRFKKCPNGYTDLCMNYAQKQRNG